jgi:hypothetical protein
MHKGVDFAAPTGTPIYAAGNGRVTKAGRIGGYGNYVEIRHNGEYSTAYAHLSRFATGIGALWALGIRVVSAARGEKQCQNYSSGGYSCSHCRSLSSLKAGTGRLWKVGRARAKPWLSLRHSCVSCVTR